MFRTIKKRDMLFFLLGVISVLLINLAFNWTENIEDFKRGFRGAKKGSITLPK